MTFGTLWSTTSAKGQSTPAAELTFSSDVGLVFTLIKDDQTELYEAVVTKLKEALANSQTEQRRQQAVGWTVYRALEPGPNNNVVYVSVLQRPVKDANYYAFRIISEIFPTEAQELHKRASGAILSMTKISLTKVTDFK